MAGSYGKVILLGRLTKDVEVRVIAKQDGTGTFGAASFSIAVERPFNSKKVDGKLVTDFFDCELTGPQASNYAGFGKKGNRVSIVGYPYFDKYKNKENIDVQKFKICVEELIILDRDESSRNDNNGGTNNGGFNNPGTNNGGFNNPGANNGFNNPGANNGFNNPAANNGFNNQAANNGFNNPAANNGFNNPAANNGFNNPAANNGFNNGNNFPDGFSPNPNDQFGLGSGNYM